MTRWEALKRTIMDPYKPTFHVSLPRERTNVTALLPLFGAARFKDGVLECSVNNGEWTTIHTFSNGTGDAEEYRTIINTFMLDNGPATVKLRLRSNSGEVAKESSLPLTVDNSDEVAQGVAKHIRGWDRSKVLMKEPLDARDFPFEGCEVRPWVDEPDAHERVTSMLAKFGIDPSLEKAFHQFIDEGALIIEKFVPPDLIMRINQDISKKLKDGAVDDQQRIRGMHLESVPAHILWAYPPMMNILHCIFGSAPAPCQSLTFVNGSQQGVHQDTIHLTPFPEGFMVGVWYPLEDIQPDSGPVMYHPGSHRLPVVYTHTLGVEQAGKRLDRIGSYYDKYFERLKSDLAAHYPKKVAYLPKAGDVLVWHSNLAHEGSPRTNMQRTRRSIVFHYFARGCAAWYDSFGQVSHRFDLKTGSMQR